jgi:hypothetical protein
MILAGDIGGTKTVIAHYDETGGSLRQLRVATLKSWEHRNKRVLPAFAKSTHAKDSKNRKPSRVRRGLTPKP